MHSNDKEFNKITNTYLDEVAQSLGYCLVRLRKVSDNVYSVREYMSIGTQEDCIKSYNYLKEIDISVCQQLNDTPTYYTELAISTTDRIHKNTLRRLTRDYLTNLQWKNLRDSPPHNK